MTICAFPLYVLKRQKLGVCVSTLTAMLIFIAFLACVAFQAVKNFQLRNLNVSLRKKDYDMVARWYVVHTYSGYENKVKTDLEKTVKNRELEDYFFDIVVPMEEQIEIKDGKRKANLKKVFPGYVLIKMIVTEKTWYIVRNTRGVTGFVGSGTDPIPLTDAEIRSMGFEQVQVNVDYNVNDTVRIMEGALANFTGTVTEINKEKHKVKVSVSMFGRETPVELDFSQVQKIS